MPTIKIERYTFRFYSSDIGEAPHVQARLLENWNEYFNR